MKTKHTPGPWQARDYTNDKGDIWISCDAWTKAGRPLGGTLATAHKTGCGDGCVEANAALIAAAPELLAALRDLVRVAKAYTDEAVPAAEAAIAKAEAKGG